MNLSPQSLCFANIAYICLKDAYNKIRTFQGKFDLTGKNRVPFLRIRNPSLTQSLFSRSLPFNTASLFFASTTSGSPESTSIQRVRNFYKHRKSCETNLSLLLIARC